MKYFLCKEGTEDFWIEAETRAEAEEDVITWNAVVIRELSTAEAVELEKDEKPYPKD